VARGSVPPTGLKATACETSTFGKDEPAAEHSGGVAPEPCGKNGMGILQINACYEKCMAGSNQLFTASLNVREWLYR